MKIRLAMIALLVFAFSFTAVYASEYSKVYTAYPNSTIEIKEIGSGIRFCNSDNPEVVKPHVNGKAETGKCGTARVEIKHPFSKDKKHETVLVKVANRQIIKTKKTVYEKTYGNADFNLVAKSNSPVARLKYSSSDESVAEVDNGGNVKINGAGETTIMIVALADEYYHNARKTVLVRVDKKNQEIRTDKKEYALSFADTKQKIELRSGGKAEFKSSNEDIVEVGKDEKLKPIAVGEAKVTITKKGTKNLNGSEVEVPVKVTKPTGSELALAAVEWAREIGADDSFAYGTGSTAHRAGCYFCGTNSYKKAKGCEKTYCCNTFCFSAYAHGAQLPEMLKDCQNGHNAAWGEEWEKYGFKNIGKPDFSELLPGDVITQSNHMWMISEPENDLCVESTGGTWSSSSISEHDGAEKKYGGARFVLRYSPQD